MPSKGEVRVLAALKLMGDYRITRELQLGNRLRLDFYVKEFNLGVEVDGTQHDTINSFHFESKAAFREAQNRDRIKDDVCKAKGITLIRLKYKEVMSAGSAESLRDLIYARIQKARSKEKEDSDTGW